MIDVAVNQNAEHIAKLEDYCRDVRALQHFLMSHPDLPVSYVSGISASIEVPYVMVDGVRDYNRVDLVEVARLVRIMKDGGTVEKRPWGMNDEHLEYKRRLGKRATVTLDIQRNAVCTPRIVGTETVEVVDPHAPKITVTRDVVAWDCAPLLEQAIAEESTDA